MVFCKLAGAGQRKRKRAATPQYAFCPNPPAMFFDKLFAENQSKSGAYFVVGAGSGVIFVDAE